MIMAMSILIPTIMYGFTPIVITIRTVITAITANTDMATVIIATVTVTMTTMMMTDAVRDKSGVPHSQRAVNPV